MVLRQNDYVLQIFNISESALIPIHRSQSLSIDTEYKTALNIQLSEDGTVSHSIEDTPVTVCTFDVNLITTSPNKNVNSLHWLSAISGEKVSGKYRESFFNLGRTVSHFPDGKSLTEISDFCVGITGGTVRCDSFIALRNPIQSKLARIHALMNAQASSLEFNVSVDAPATASISLETDGLSTYIKNLRGVDIDVRYVGMAEELSQIVTTAEFSRMVAVWVNWRPIRNWSVIGNNEIDFSTIPNFRVYNGDVIKYLYIPYSGERTWASYELKDSLKDAATYKAQIVGKIIVDTIENRVIYGFYPILKDEEINVIQSDGMNCVIALRAGTVQINKSYYYTGFTEGIIDTITVGNGYTTITDASFTETTVDFWIGATLTIQDGNGAGETLKVIGYSNGGIFLLDGEYSITPTVLSPFRLNACKVTGSVGDTGIYVALDINGHAVLVTDSVAPSDSVKVATITMVGGDIATYEDDRVFSANIVDRVQSISYSIPLDREEIKELGYEGLIDRALNKPVNITASLTAKDVSEELLEMLTNSGDETIRPEDYRNDVGIQVCLYKEKPATADKIYKESDLAMVFETTMGRVTTNNLSANTGASGDCNIEIISDNLRIFIIE